MARVINPTIHGVLDYALALAFLLAPGLVDFNDTAANLSYVIGIVYLAASLLTRYPLGAIHMIASITPCTGNGIMWIAPSG